MRSPTAAPGAGSRAIRIGVKATASCVAAPVADALVDDNVQRGASPFVVAGAPVAQARLTRIASPHRAHDTIVIARRTSTSAFVRIVPLD